MGGKGSGGFGGGRPPMDSVMDHRWWKDVRAIDPEEPGDASVGIVCDPSDVDHQEWHWVFRPWLDDDEKNTKVGHKGKTREVGTWIYIEFGTARFEPVGDRLWPVCDYEGCVNPRHKNVVGAGESLALRRVEVRKRRLEKQENDAKPLRDQWFDDELTGRRWNIGLIADSAYMNWMMHDADDMVGMLEWDEGCEEARPGEPGAGKIDTAGLCRNHLYSRQLLEKMLMECPELDEVRKRIPGFMLPPQIRWDDLEKNRVRWKGAVEEWDRKCAVLTSAAAAAAAADVARSVIQCPKCGSIRFGAAAAPPPAASPSPAAASTARVRIPPKPAALRRAHSRRRGG